MVVRMSKIVMAAMSSIRVNPCDDLFVSATWVDFKIERLLAVS